MRKSSIPNEYRCFFPWIRLPFFVSVCFLLLSCTQANVSRFEVQRPSRITVPKEVTKVFIRADLVQASNDRLGLKSKMLKQLASELNKWGRFQAEVVENLDKQNIDSEKETIAVIQGEIVSGGEVDRGQFTDLATCSGGISGRISSAGSASITGEAITLDSWRGFVCREGTVVGDVAQIAITSALSLAGLGETIPPKNQAVRVYQYKNLSLFAQANFSFTVIGRERETLAIRADSSSFGRSIKNNKSFRNVQESHLVAQTLGRVITHTRSPVFPIPVRQAALAEKSNPEKRFYDGRLQAVPQIKDLPDGERAKIIDRLMTRTLQSFIRMISPYQIMVDAEVAAGGKADAGALLESGRAATARQKIEKIEADQRDAADWYNLGLSYEASALSVEDYEDARRYYIIALKKNPGNPLFAKGIGRTRTYLKDARKMANQNQ